MTETSIPDLYPLPSPFFYVFAQDGKMSFGWEQPGFYIKAGSRTRHSFPLTEDGWKSAWEMMSSDYPQLATKVAAAVERIALARIAAAQPVKPPLPMLIVTTNEISGYRITKVHGDVFGLTVRARNVFSNMGAQFHTLVGGEVLGYTKMLIDSRNEARERLWNGARAKGANAVIAMRFDCNEIGGIMSEIAAYGTAVTVEPLSEIVATALSEAQQAE